MGTLVEKRLDDEQTLIEIRKTLDEYFGLGFNAAELGLSEKEREKEERRVLDKLQRLTGFRYTCHACGSFYYTCCDC